MRNVYSMVLVLLPHRLYCSLVFCDKFLYYPEVILKYSPMQGCLLCWIVCVKECLTKIQSVGYYMFVDGMVASRACEVQQCVPLLLPWHNHQLLLTCSHRVGVVHDWRGSG
jgi:hypothetical protein